MRYSPGFGTTASCQSDLCPWITVLPTYAVYVTDHGGYTGKTRATSGDNADVLIGVLAELILTVLLVVQVGHRLTER